MSQENTDQPQQDPSADPAVTNEPQLQDQQDAEQEAEQDNLPAFEFSSEDAGTLKKKVTVTVPRERINAKLDEMFGELGESAQIPGFRIGHAPRRLVEKRFAKDVSRDVRNALVGESLGDVLDKADFKPLGEPDLDIEEIELPDSGSMEYSFTVEIAPQFDLPSLENIPVEKRRIEVTDKIIAENIDEWRQRRADFEDTNEPAAEGDVVTADIKIGGEGIDPPVDEKGLTLRVAAGQIKGLPLVDLGEELTGKKVGDTAVMTIQVPQSHPTESWRGKTAEVSVTLTAVRHRVLPKPDDNFAKSIGFDSIDELRNAVAEQMKQRVEADAQRAMRDQICKYLIDNTQFDLPNEVAARHAARLLQRRYIDLLQQGISRERIDENLTKIKAAADEESAGILKLEFILGKIAENENIEADDGEVNSQIASMASMYNRRPERLRHELESKGDLDAIHQQIIEQKVLDKLLTQAKVTEVADQPEDAAEANKAEKKTKSKAKASETKTKTKTKDSKPKEKTSKPKAKAKKKTKPDDKEK